MHRQLLICDKWNAGNAGRVGDITAWGYPLITGWPRINYNPTKTQARRRNVALLRRPYPAGRGTAPIRGTRRDRAFPAYLESIVSNVSSISRPLSLSRRVSTRPRYVLRIARGSALEARYVTRKKCTKEETRASVPRCLTPTLNSISYLKSESAAEEERWRFSGSSVMRNHDAEEKRFRAFCPGKMDIAEARPEARLQLFIAFPFRFPADKGTDGAGREKVGDRERGGNCERLDYSGSEREGGGECRVSLLARKNGV